MGEFEFVYKTELISTDLGHGNSRLFTQPFIQVQIKETSNLRVTGLCVGNSPVTGEFPAQMTSNA